MSVICFIIPLDMELHKVYLEKISFILATTPQILYITLDGKFDYLVFQMRGEKKMWEIEINFEKLGKLKIILWSLNAFNQLNTPLLKTSAFSVLLYF